MSRPETRFVRTPRGSVAYQVFGRGERDIVLVTTWTSNIDAYWEEPSAVRYLDRLAEMGRVILIDKLSSGVSDIHISGHVAPLEETMDDIRDVMREIGSEQAALIGDTEGGMLAMMLAATYPDQFPVLVLVNSYARFRRADDYPIGAPDEFVRRVGEAYLAQHGTTGDALYLTAPSVADDTRFKSWYRRFQRAAQKQRIAAEAVEWVANTDVRGVLSSIQADTLVVQKRDARYHRLPYSQFLADNIPSARLQVVEGADTWPFHAGDFTSTLDAVEEFLLGDRVHVQAQRMLATVMFTDIVGSTALASELGDERWLDLRAAHDRVVHDSIARFRGNEIAMTGDGCLATFDGPQRAILCAMAIREELGKIGLPIRAGIHTGEIETRGGDIGGIAVHIASRVMDAAESGGVMVSSTVKDLVVGSPLGFESCGAFEMKGVPGSWNLFEAHAPGTEASDGVGLASPSGREPSPG
jgi:class 3 adenylate cyclase